MFKTAKGWQNRWAADLDDVKLDGATRKRGSFFVDQSKTSFVMEHLPSEFFQPHAGAELCSLCQNAFGLLFERSKKRTCVICGFVVCGRCGPASAIPGDVKRGQQHGHGYDGEAIDAKYCLYCVEAYNTVSKTASVNHKL